MLTGVYVRDGPLENFVIVLIEEIKLFFSSNTTKRYRSQQDSNLRGQSPIDF